MKHQFNRNKSTSIPKMRAFALFSVLTLGVSLSSASYANHPISDKAITGIATDIYTLGNIISGSSSGTYNNSQYRQDNSFATTFTKTNSTRALNTIVANYPEYQRAEVRAQYQELYNAFPIVAKNAGIPTNDVASGLATLISAGYVAYNNKTFDDRYAKAIANQMRSALQNSGAMAKMSNAEKQDFYDQMVLISMALFALKAEVDHTSNPSTKALMRQAGEDILKGLFKVDASQVHINANGMSISAN